MIMLRRGAARHCSRLKNAFEVRSFSCTVSSRRIPGLNNVHTAAPTTQQNPLHWHCAPCRWYFTNADQMKRSDPYATLGLEWGATATDIKDAYHRLARELHPDVSDLEPEAALDQFRAVKAAYDKLMNNRNSAVGAHRTDLLEEWSFAVWRSGDLIAQERTDVAGARRKRPAKPAESMKRKWGVTALGHPDGRGASSGRGEYLSSGEGSARRSSTVGTGRSKWVQEKEFRPWNPEEGGLKGVSRYRKAKAPKSKEDAG